MQKNQSRKSQKETQRKQEMETGNIWGGIGINPDERGSKPLSGFFDGKEFAYGSLRNPRFSLRRSLFLTSAYGAYGGNVESPQ